MVNIFEHLVDSIVRYFSHQAISIWDVKRKCIFATDIYKEYFDIDDINGKEIGELSEYLYHHQDEFRERITNRVQLYKVPVMAYYIIPNKSSKDYGIHSVIVTPILSEVGEVIGYLSNVQLVENTIALKGLLQKICPNKYNDIRIQNISKNSKITRRERIIIFLLLVGKSHKEIAVTLSEIYKKDILPNSVSSIISKQIYPKFNVYNNSDLIALALQFNLLYNIPYELLCALPMIILTIENPNYKNLSKIIPETLWQKL